MKDQETVAVVGLGYVGLPLALLAAGKGYRVVGIDADRAKVAKLNKGVAPQVDGITSEAIRHSGIHFTAEFALAAEADTIIVCVPTPVDEHLMPDLGPVVSACKQIASHLRPGQLVILESTVNPGVSESVVLPALEASGLKGGRDFHLAHCPERINPGDQQWDVANIPRVVGSLDQVGLDKALKFYRSIVSGEIHPMGSIKEAEAVKVKNSFRDINIAFVNELAMSFDQLGINVLNVIDGAATKPFAFMAHSPGCGVGGHCIPVDPYYLIEYARENGFNHELLSMARSINRRMPLYTAHLTADLLARTDTDIKGARVTVLGLAYKADISDIRESPAHVIVEALGEMGANVTVYDPYVPSTHPAKSLEQRVAVALAAGEEGKSYYESLHPAYQPIAQAVDGADAVVVATGHRVFRELDPGVLARAGVKAVVDGRNCLDRTRIEGLGILYKGIGH